jgi:hypothetical protein
MLKNPTLAALLTIAFCILGIVGDAILGADRVWTRIEGVLNFPARIALAIVGTGHGFAQLVFPFLFALLFYYAAFWLLLVCIRRGVSQNAN